MHRLNISYKQFYVTLNEIWLFESDPNAPSTWSKPGGKQWQRSIRGRRNWDVELGPCAVIRHLCSVAFVWETKRPQADSSRSLIDRQVSCSIMWPRGNFNVTAWLHHLNRRLHGHDWKWNLSYTLLWVEIVLNCCHHISFAHNCMFICQN